MAQETQLDIHEIDKLLADDDFIDDFDFSEDLSAQFVDAEDILDEDLVDDSESHIPSDLDESAIEASSSEVGVGGVVSSDVIASVSQELNNLEFASFGVGKNPTRSLKIAVGLAVILWLTQLFGVLFLLKQPVIIRDEIRSLTVETDFSRPPQPSAETVAPVSVEEMVVTTNPAEPDIFLFTLYLPLYSLDGLQVFSAEIEVIQFQESGRLLVAGQKKLQEGLRLLLQEAIGERLREEIVDVKGHLTSMIIPYLENFFSERQVDLNKVKISIYNPHVQ